MRATVCTVLAVGYWLGMAACSKPQPDPKEGTSAAEPADTAQASATSAASRNEAAGPAATPGVPPPPHIDLSEPAKPSAALLASFRPPESDPADVAAVKQRLLAGESSSRILKELQRLAGKHGSNAELPYLMGQVYFSKLWVSDGLKAFRRAIAIDPELRESPFLIRAAVGGLGNDSDHRQVARFLSQDIGLPAAPYLEEVLYGDWRGQVKERADAILRSLK